MKPWEEAWNQDGTAIDIDHPESVERIALALGPEMESALARAALIAAAPELYRVLEALANAVEPWRDDELAQALAALKKARGET